MESLYTLSPFEQMLKDWYVKHGELMPWDIFLLKERQFRKQLRDCPNPYQMIDPCYLNYENAIYDRNHNMIDLKNIPALLSNKYIILKQPRYFPFVSANNNDLKLTYVYSGRCQVTLSDGCQSKIWHLTEGDFVLIPKNTQEAFYIDNDDSIIFNFTIVAEALHQILSASNSNKAAALLITTIKSPFLCRCPGTPWIRTMAEQMVNEVLHQSLNSHPVNFLTLSLFMAIIQREYEATILSRENKNIAAYAPAFSEYLQHHFSDFSLSAMAETFSLSTAHISRLFKRYTGQTISRALREHRVQIAKYLLANSSESVESIAEHVGYSDVSYFIEIFKKECHVTPYQYRLSQIRCHTPDTPLHT